MQHIPVDRIPDLAVLDAFLSSDEAPQDCMELSELDGFLAGIVAGPETIMPSEWLPMVWGGEEPAFADMDQANLILGAIMSRYNEAIRLLDAIPSEYRPILVETEDGSVDASDWAVGFLAAVTLRQEAWMPLVIDPEAGMLMGPIMLVASTSQTANLPLDEDERLPAEEMEKLLSDPVPLLSITAAGIRRFFTENRQAVARRRAGLKQNPKRAPVRGRRPH